MELPRKNKIALGLIVFAIIIGAIMIYNKRKERPAGEALGNFLLLGAIQAEEACLVGAWGVDRYVEVITGDTFELSSAEEADLSSCISTTD